MIRRAENPLRPAIDYTAQFCLSRVRKRHRDEPVVSEIIFPIVTWNKKASNQLMGTYLFFALWFGSQAWTAGPRTGLYPSWDFEPPVP